MGLKHLLIDAKNEITGLRRRNELLEAQQSVVEVFAAAFGLKRSQGGMSIDVAWMLQKEIDDLKLREVTTPLTLGAEADALRLRWLCQDHDDRDTRKRRDEILGRMSVISHTVAADAIDTAMREALKIE